MLARYALREPDDADPKVRMWLDFALSSVERGRLAIQTLGGRAAVRGASVLDVGCAYGGFLVAAREAGAASACGIDLAADLLELARRQLSDYRVRAELRQADITDWNSVADLGAFDLILCNDVIEHVRDPAACVHHLARLLRPGGSVYLEIPNARCVDFLLHDGHFGEFGVTLLPPAPSVAWLRRRLAQPDAVLYAALGYYLALLSREGLATRLANELPHTAELEALSATLSVKFDEFETRLGGFAGEGTGEADAGVLALRHEIEERGRLEIRRFRELADDLAAAASPAERQLLLTRLWLDYALPFWRLSASRLA